MEASTGGKQIEFRLFSWFTFGLNDMGHFIQYQGWRMGVMEAWFGEYFYLFTVFVSNILRFAILVVVFCRLLFYSFLNSDFVSELDNITANQSVLIHTITVSRILGTIIDYGYVLQ